MIIFAIRLCNGLIRARARTREAWAGIAVQLQRHMDLAPNLVSAVPRPCLCRSKSSSFF
jgi:LemA protein